MSNPQRPLTDEERAAREARLRELRAQLNANGNGNGGAAPANSAGHYANSHVGHPTMNGNSHRYEGGSHACAYDDAAYSDDDDQDDDDGDEEAENVFLNEVESKRGSAGVRMYETQISEMLGETVETGPTARRCTVGDFELLRLAKMGDLVSFQEFAAMTGADPTTFRDNHERNALHYAADSGDVGMLRYLIDARVPFKQDEKKMTPMDIAVLNGHTAAVELLAAAFPEQTANGTRTCADAIAIFAPPPPRFTLAKAAPPVTVESRPRAFWFYPAANSSAAITGGAHGASVTVSVVSKGAEAVAAHALASCELTRDGHGFLAWLPPAEQDVLDGLLSRAVVVIAAEQPSVEECNAEGETSEHMSSSSSSVHHRVRGVAVAVPLSGTVLQSNGSFRAAAPFAVPLIAVHPTLRGAHVATRLLAEMRRVLATSDVVIFCSPRQLPVRAVGLVKWSRRAISPWTALRRSSGTEVFPDIFKYDDVLRADIIAKNALSDAFVAAHKERHAGWSLLDTNDAGRMEQLQQFLSRQAGRSFALAYVPSTVDDVRAAVAVDGFATFVCLSSGSGEVTDVIVLRRRRASEARHAGEENEAEKSNVEEENEDDTPSAMCVYALFTTLKGAEKAEAVAVAAASLNCDTVFIPNMFGFVDSDLSKANFEELLALREYLYVVKNGTEPAVASMPLSTVGIPCNFC